MIMGHFKDKVQKIWYGLFLQFLFTAGDVLSQLEIQGGVQGPTQEVKCASLMWTKQLWCESAIRIADNKQPCYDSKVSDSIHNSEEQVERSSSAEKR